jgi:hypothetical protein
MDNHARTHRMESADQTAQAPTAIGHGHQTTRIDGIQKMQHADANHLMLINSSQSEKTIYPI